MVKQYSTQTNKFHNNVRDFLSEHNARPKGGSNFARGLSSVVQVEYQQLKQDIFDYLVQNQNNDPSPEDIMQKYNITEHKFLKIIQDLLFEGKLLEDGEDSLKIADEYLK